MKISSDDKQYAASYGKPQCTIGGNNAFWNFANSSTRILRIETTVEIAVECHGSTTCRHHTNDYEEKCDPDMRRIQSRICCCCADVWETAIPNGVFTPRKKPTNAKGMAKMV